MKHSSNERVRAHYLALRPLDCDTLWKEHVAAFDRASPPERLQTVSVIRAVAVVFTEQGTPAQKDMARRWIRSLLDDPAEKIRRYAVQALPKLGADSADETALLTVWERPVSERERRAVTRTLERVGGKQTLVRTAAAASPQLRPAPQRLEANMARDTHSGTLALDAPLENGRGTRVLLECRSGLAPLVREEIAAHPRCRSIFEPGRTGSHTEPRRTATADLELTAQKPFTLDALLDLRCWSSLAFPLARLPALPHPGAPLPIEALAEAAASPHAWQILRAFTSGSIRYRWDFPARRISGAVAQRLSDTVHARRAGLLNDPRAALWEVRVRETPRSVAVDLLPKFRPDPRFAYRTGDVPAASHPPLAAAIARIAEVGSPPFERGERIWDPFCGSGLELAECALQRAPALLLGTDLDPGACRVAAANVASALSKIPRAPSLETRFECGDFRDVLRLGIPEQSLTLIVTNPPLGKRVPQKSLEELMGSLFTLAERLLVPGGRLVLVNPCANRPAPPGLRRISSREVDVGFAHFPIEKYLREKHSPVRTPGARQPIASQKAARPRHRFR